MKNKSSIVSRIRSSVVLQRMVMLFLTLAGTTWSDAAQYVKSNNADNLNLATAWTNNAVPGAGDIALWDVTVADANNTTNALGADTSWNGIKIIDPAGPAQVDAGYTLTVGESGIDMSAATVNLTLACGVATPANSAEAWRVGAARTLSVPGTFTQDPLSALYFDLDVGATVNFATGTVSNILYQTTFNGYDVGALDASLNVVNAGSIIPDGYSPNPSTFSGNPASAYCDVVNGNTGTSGDVNPSGTYYPHIIRFNQPQPNRDYWLWEAAGKKTYFSAPATTILVTTNVGEQDVVFEGTYNTFRYNGGSLIIAQENPAGTFSFTGPFTSANNAGTMTKYGVGRAIFNTDLPAPHPVGVLEGEFVLNGNAGADVSVGDEALFRCNGTVSGALTVNTGGTVSPGNENAVGALAASGDVTLSSGSMVQFYSLGTLVANTTPLMTVAGNLTVGGPVSVSITAGLAPIGQYPLIQWTNSISAGDFANFNLAHMPLRTEGYLSNNVANNSIDLVVTNVSEPIKWAVGNGTWDIDGTANWLDPHGNSVKYQEAGGESDSVLFDASATGASPITVTLNTSVSPATVAADGSKNYIFTGSGGISGIGSLTKTGSGTLTMGTTNTFSGGVNLNGGVVNFSSMDNLGTGNVSFDGGMLQYASGNVSDISVQSVIIGAGGATIDVGGNNVTYAAAIGNGGAGGLTKLGSGLLTLNGANDYYGHTLISQGALGLASRTTLPHSTNIVVSSGATYDVSGVGIYHLVSGIGQTLSGSGSVYVNGTFFEDVGTAISPGTTNTIGTLDLTAGSTAYCSLQISGALYMNVTTSGSDLIIANDATINAGSDLYIYSSGLSNGDYELLRTDSGYTDNGFTLHFSQTGKIGSLVWIGGSLYLEVADQATGDLTWSGTGSSWDQLATTDWYLTGGTMPWAFTNGDTVRFDEVGSANANVTLNGILQPSLVVVSNSATDYIFSDGGGAKISGSARLLKQGAGSLTINTLNDNNGPTTIQEGTVTVVGGISSAAVTNNGMLVMNSTVSQTFASMTGTGGLNVNQSGAGTTVSGVANYTGPTTINAGTLTIGSGGADGVMSTSAITNNGTLILNSSTDWNYNIPDTGSGNFRKQNTNTLTISGANTRTGETRADNGRIILANANQLAGSVRLEGDAVMDINGNNQSWTGLGGGSSGAKIVNDAGAGTNLLTISLADGVTNDVQAQVVDNEGSGGSIGLLKTGAGQLFLHSSANTYSGGTEIREGSIRAHYTGEFGSGPVNLTGGAIYLTGGSFTNVVNLLRPAGLATDSLGCAGNITFVAPIAGTNDLQIQWNDGSSGPLTLRLSGGATQWADVTNILYLRGGATYGGILRWDTDVTMEDITVDLNSSNVRIASSGAHAIPLGAVVGSVNSASLGASSGSTFYIGAKNLSTTFAGYLGSLTGTVANGLVKEGSGTLTLTGTNTFTGGLTVSNGTLAVAQDAAPSLMSPVRVASGATLDVTGLAGSTLHLGDNTNDIAQTLAGNGTVNGSVVIDTNATVSPGNSIGTLTINNALTIDGAATMELNRTNSQTADLINAAAFSGTGTVNVTNIGPDLVANDTFQLFNQAVSGVTVNLPTSNAVNTVAYTWSNRVDLDGSIKLLSATSVINPNPPQIQVSASGSTLSLAWPTNAGWILQTNSVGLTDTNAWYSYPGSDAITNVDIMIDPAESNVFFRMVKP